MQCQLCGKRPAVVHFTEIVNNKKSEYHVCEKCAEERGYHTPLVKTKFSVGDLLAGMVDQTGAGEEAKVGRVQCPRCHMVYSSFKETGRLGCSECYTTFRAQLRPLLRRIHGSTKHVGKTPFAIPRASRCAARFSVSTKTCRPRSSTRSLRPRPSSATGSG